MISTRLRIRFSKEGDLRLISHRDLVRTLERMFRRAAVPLAMSEGYHPKVRMMLPSALALGISGFHEVMEVQLAENLAGDELHVRLSAHAPPGIQIKSVTALPPGASKARAASAAYSVQVPPDRQGPLQSAIGRLLAQESHLIARTRGDNRLDLLADLADLRLQGEVLHFTLHIRQEGSVRAREVLEALGVADLEALGFPLARTDVELAG